MKYFAVVILYLVIFKAAVSAELKVEHVANAGVKITSGGKVVLIDALFGPHSRFNFLDDAAFNTLVQQQADVALSTHMHADHFGAKRVTQFLKQNKQSLFIGTPEALDELRGKVPDEQIKTAHFSGMYSKDISHNKVKISVLQFPHMMPDLEQAQNYAYIVEVNGWKVLHVGDADVNADVIAAHDLASKEIDIALIHDLFPHRHKNYQELINKMNVGKVMFVHMTDDKAIPMAQWLKANLPEAGMLVTGYENIVLTKNAEK